MNFKKMERYLNHFTSDLKTRWGELTGNESLVFKGRLGMLEAKLGLLVGKAREAVTTGFEQIRDAIAGRGARIVGKLEETADRATDAVK